MEEPKSKPPSRIDKVRIFGKTWELRRFDHPVGGKDSGVCEHQHLRIDIDASRPLEYVQDTILHELLHAVEFELQLNLGERQVAALATGLLSVLKDNPYIRKFLLK